MNDEIIYPTSFQCIDCVIRKVDRFETKFLLGRRKHSTEYRILGGFVDPDKDSSLEGAAVREKNEEAGIGLECTYPKYLFSFRVDDPRYRESKHKIMSAVFLFDYTYGMPKAGDDIFQVGWFSKESIRDLDVGFIAKEHAPIINYILNNL